MAPRVLVRPEQIYVVAHAGEHFYIGGDRHETIPWESLAGCHIFALSELDLRGLLEDAVTGSYMILDGSANERRGVRGFKVSIGAWGHGGHVECRAIDTWCMPVDQNEDPVIETGRAQSVLRDVCSRVNGCSIPFRSTAMRWLDAIYREHNVEPDGLVEPLPEKIGLFCRKAHVGGPILHTRTTLAPYASLDRTRAYGNAMLGDLPCGPPQEVDLGKDRMRRWRPVDLQRMTGIVEATVEVFPGPAVSLLPLMRWHYLTRRTRTIYPTGTMRGTWCIHELVYLEQSGRGQVTDLHRAVVFEPRPVLAPVIRFVRRMEPQLPITVKRMEHILYGRCARTLQFTRFGTGYSGQPLPGDILTPDVLVRLGPSARISRLPMGKGAVVPLPIYEITGKLSGTASRGTIDRPDRSAWITSINRVAMSHAIDMLDAKLKVSRSGEYVGRIYVDGMDVEIPTGTKLDLDGFKIKRRGPSVRIYRAGSFAADLDDGTTEIESAGTMLPDNATEDDLVKILRQSSEMDQGPFAGGRSWSALVGELDPRMAPDQRSEPLHIDTSFADILGFS